MKRITPLLWIFAGFVLGFVGFRFAGERYRLEQDFYLRDTWSGKVYLAKEGAWVQR